MGRPCPPCCTCSVCIGGIEGLTPDEDAQLVELLNGPHKVCECGSPSCASPIGTPIVIREPGVRGA